MSQLSSTHSLLKYVLVLCISVLASCAQSPGQNKGSAESYWDNPNNAPLLEQYQKWQGTPYRLGGNNLQGVDCSAFVQAVYFEAYGVTLPRTTAHQAKIGTKINFNVAKSGDLVFFRTSRKARHVGIYLGSSSFIHASTSQGVIISRLDNPYWASVFWHFRALN